MGVISYLQQKNNFINFNLLIIKFFNVDTNGCKQTVDELGALEVSSHVNARLNKFLSSLLSENYVGVYQYSHILLGAQIFTGGPAPSPFSAGYFPASDRGINIQTKNCNYTNCTCTLCR